MTGDLFSNFLFSVNVVLPVFISPLAILIGLRGKSLVVLFVMYSTPTTVSSFVMADGMGNDRSLAANIVLMTSLASPLGCLC